MLTVCWFGQHFGRSRASQVGAAHYAHVVIRIEPNPSKGYKFLDETLAGAIPERFLDPVNRGVRYALKAGKTIAGCEIVDAKVTLCDGSYHE